MDGSEQVYQPLTDTIKNNLRGEDPAQINMEQPGDACGLPLGAHWKRY